MLSRVKPGYWALLLLAILLWNASSANASFNCGIKPILPIGCEDAVCVCDDDGNCQWVFVCNQ